MFRVIPEGLDYREHVLLKDGQGIELLPAIPAHISLVTDFMDTLSKDTLRMRFMAAISQVSRSVIEALCQGDFKENGCLLAISEKDNVRKVIGLGNYIGMGNGRSAEMAFLVSDEYQGKGISTLILERLAGLAAANGYVELEAEVLPDNQPMINVFKSSGFQIHQVWDSDSVHIELPVSSGIAMRQRAELRERIAIANSLTPLFNPSVVAVVGASRDSSAIGNMIFRNILRNGFGGTLYPINPQAASVNGVKAYTHLKGLPETIDLAVVAVPAETVLTVAREAIEKGAKGLIVVSAGFAEAGDDGIERQRELVELVRSHGVRLIGPSCLGVMNTAPDIRMNASLAPSLPLPGPAGFFSHSAALGLVILEYATKKGLGFTTFVSAGNRADVSGNDLLQYWEEDSNTGMAILYLETFGNPRRFVRIARRMSHKKPILCVKSARSRVGRKTAEAKTGNISGENTAVTALFQQTGIILAETLDELFDVAVVLAHQPLPEGNRVSIIANSSGVGTIFADACEVNGLIIAGPGLVDLGAFTSPERYESAVFEALSHDEVDSLMVGFACVGQCSSGPVSAAIRKGVERAEATTGKRKPVLLCMMGEVGSISLVEESGNPGEKRLFPAFRFPESAPRALSRVVNYSNFQKKPEGQVVWYENIQADIARKRVTSLLSDALSEEPVPLDSDAIEDILSCFGFQPILQHKAASGETQTIEVRPDKLFGPLIVLNLKDRVPVIRVTPLTDRDLEEIRELSGIEVSGKLLEALGRLSQMIEEIPWLWTVRLPIISDDLSVFIPNATITVKPGGARNPNW
jgi:acetate---CoA ligase (ADP-forming)